MNAGGFPKENIIFAINDLAFCGGQRTVVHAANELSKLGYRVWVLTLLSGGRDDLKSALKIDPQNIAHIPFKGLFNLGAFIKLVRFLRAAKPDAIFSNLFFTNYQMRLAKIFLPSLRVFIREGNMPKEKSARVRRADALLSLLTEKVIVNAKAIGSELVKAGLIHQGKIEVVYNGIDQDFFSPAPPEERIKIRTSLGIPKFAFVFVNTASLTKKKGHTFLLGAFSELVKENQREQLFLLLVGSGPLEKTLRDQVKELKLGERVIFTGERKDVKNCFAASDVFVLSSLWEGVPNAMLEALASGLPVVATSVGGVPEIVKDSHNGLLTPAESIHGLKAAMHKLWSDVKLRSMLQSRASSSVAHLSWQNHVAELVRIARL